jgi:hypothetical protein
MAEIMGDRLGEGLIGDTQVLVAAPVQNRGTIV